jgi:GDP-L-fucose synthase
MNRDSKIFVAGHRGLVGSAIVRELKRIGYANILMRSRAEVDLLDPRAVESFFEVERPQYVFFAARHPAGVLPLGESPNGDQYIGLSLAIRS